MIVDNFVAILMIFIINNDHHIILSLLYYHIILKNIVKYYGHTTYCLIPTVVQRSGLENIRQVLVLNCTDINLTLYLISFWQRSYQTVRN